MTDEIKTTLKAIGYSDDEVTGLNPATVAYYRAMGYLPDAVNNYLALIGWAKDGTTEFFSRKDLTNDFSIDGIHKSPGAFDPEKFKYINSEHLKKMSLEDKVENCIPYLEKAGIVPDIEKTTKIVVAIGDRMKVFSDILNYGVYFFRDPVYDEKAFDKRIKKDNIPELLQWFSNEIGNILDYNSLELEKALHEFADKHNVKFGDMVHALRISTTGQPVGPGLFDCMNILGCAEVQRRIFMAVEKSRLT
jgi:glutamyl-tRNA synthetase